MLALYRTFNDEHSECNLEFQKLIKYNCELIPNTGQVKANKKKSQLYTNLLTEYRKVWFQNCLHLLNDVCKRSTIHVLKNKIYYTIVVKRLMAQNYMRALCCLVYFELLYYLFAN